MADMEQLDSELLNWIAAHTDDDALRAQIAGASIKRRDYMRTGWFIYLSPPPEAAAVAADVRPVCPHILSPELMDGAGCSLFLRNGQLHYLEIYSRGGFFPEELKTYEITEAD